MAITSSLKTQAGDLAASFNGAAISLANAHLCGVPSVISSASSLNGALKLQLSIDESSPTNWADVSGSSTAVTADGVTQWSLTNVTARWVRLVYTRTGGTGDVSTNFNVKNEY